MQYSLLQKTILWCLGFISYKLWKRYLNSILEPQVKLAAKHRISESDFEAFLSAKNVSISQPPEPLSGRMTVTNAKEYRVLLEIVQTLFPEGREINWVDTEHQHELEHFHAALQLNPLTIAYFGIQFYWFQDKLEADTAFVSLLSPDRDWTPEDDYAIISAPTQKSPRDLMNLELLQNVIKTL